MNFMIFTDSGTDLPSAYMTEHNIQSVDLTLIFEDGQWQASELDDGSFYDKLRKSPTLPKTASPSPQAYYETFKSVQPDLPILLVTLSSKLSSSYQHAVMAKNMLLEEEPNRQIAVFDSRSASAGQSLHIVKAVELREKALSFSEVEQIMEKHIEESRTLFILESYNNLIKGGRLEKWKGKMASMLNIQLLMGANEEGMIELVEKVRGKKRALKTLVERIGDFEKNTENKILTITHANREERAKKLLNDIKKRYNFRNIVLSDIGPLCGIYADEGGIVIGF